MESCWERKERVMSRRASVIAGLLGFSIFSLSFLSACSEDKAAKAKPNVTVPVTVGTVLKKDVPVQVRAIGNVQPYCSVTVKSQIGGELIKVNFKEGQDVKQGDLLFVIDPRPYEAALKQAEANLARNTAQVEQAKANLERSITQSKNAEVDARRYESLLQKGVVAREQYDRFRTASKALQATVRADRAALEHARAAVGVDRAAIEYAKIQLGYCFIRSPLSGRTGNLIAHQGSVIKANDINMVVINQMMPIYVSFALPEQFLSEIKKYMAAGKLSVEAVIPPEEKQPEQGVVTFVDNTVDSSTGTIRLKGTFANSEKRLWPGQFANVVLTLTTEPNAVVAPSQAVQTGQDGTYVFVVKPDRTVESRRVVVGITHNDEILIKDGLNPGETVVTDGQLRLRPGAMVEVKTSLSTPAPASRGKAP